MSASEFSLHSAEIVKVKGKWRVVVHLDHPKLALIQPDNPLASVLPELQGLRLGTYDMSWEIDEPDDRKALVIAGKLIEIAGNALLADSKASEVLESMS